MGIIGTQETERSPKTENNEHKYCSHCGTPVKKETFTRGFDTQTGQPNSYVRVYCPRSKEREPWYKILAGADQFGYIDHDNYTASANRPIPNKGQNLYKN